MKKFIYLFGLLVNLFLPSFLLSQTITTSAISPLEYCANTDLTVSYTADNGFAADNVFIAQLSDSNGSFNNFINIGHLKSSISGTITATIPTKQYDGTKFRIRVISSNPYLLGSDNGADILIHSLPINQWEITKNRNYYKLYDSVSFSSSSENLDYYSPAKWDFGEGAIPPTFLGYVPPAVRYGSLGLKNVIFKIDTLTNCSYKVESSNNVKIIGCDIMIDSNNVKTYDSADHHLPFPNNLHMLEHQVWVLPNASVTVDIGYGEKVFIVETGGNLVIKGYAVACVFYLKPGASVRATQGFYNCGIVRCPGSSINIPDTNTAKNDVHRLTVVECDQLQVNYSTAPQQGKEILAALGYSDVKENQAPSINLNIFPNPVTDILHISGDYSGQQVRIYSPEGFKVYEAEFTNEIDLSKLPVGIYFMRVRDKIAKFSKF